MTHPPYTAEAARLKRATSFSGLAVHHLHRRIGASWSVMYAIMEGRASIAESGYADAIAQVLGVSVRWLLTGEVSRAGQAAIAEFERTSAYARMADAERDRIRELLEMLHGGDEIAPRNDQS